MQQQEPVPEQFYDYIQTPLGKMAFCANEHALLSILFVETVADKKPNRITTLAKQQLTDYFNGKRIEFDLPLQAKGTAFQQSVWQALTTIDYGLTCSYADIAEKIENPKAVRAVGSANGKNPMTIVVPCHRVIGRDGSLTGYASGVERKAWLLEHEKNYAGL